MTFGNPFYLWALLGLLVPIAIHLWSKKEAKIIKIGSIQFLNASDSKQSRSIQLNEIWLLILRMMIIAIVVLILSEPKLKTNTINSPITYIVETSLLKNDAIITLIDSINNDVEIRLLKTDLPKWDSDEENFKAKEIPKYWQLIQEMNNLKTDSIVVFTNAFVKGFKGKRPAKTREINWVVLDSGNTINKALLVVQKKENLKITSVLSDAKHTSIFSELLPNNDKRFQYSTNKDSIQFMNSGKEQIFPIHKETPVNVLLYYSEGLSSEKAYIETSFKVLSSYLNRNIDLKVKKDVNDIALDTFDLVVWLSEKIPPKITNRLLFFKEDEFANHLIVPTISKNIFQLTEHLTIENSTSAHLTEQLLGVLNLDATLEKQISEIDKRQVDVKELESNNSKKEKNKMQLASLDISKWFWFSLLFFIIIERFLANYKKQ
tara:strand:- start:10578 stop:11876 length:1299 start_codon:yes stop_codon:yes gene_type:complete